MQGQHKALVWSPGNRKNSSSETEFGGATTDEMPPQRWVYGWIWHLGPYHRSRLFVVFCISTRSWDNSPKSNNMFQIFWVSSQHVTRVQHTLNRDSRIGLCFKMNHRGNIDLFTWLRVTTFESQDMRHASQTRYIYSCTDFTNLYWIKPRYASP